MYNEVTQNKSAVVVDKVKRRLENPLTEAQKAKKLAVEAERLPKIQRTAERNSERLRAMAERWSVAGAEGLAAEAFRKYIRRKSHPLTVKEKAEKAKADAKRRDAASAEFLAFDAIRKSARLKTNPLTADVTATSQYVPNTAHSHW